MSDTDNPEAEPETLFYSEANDEPETKVEAPTEEAITPEDQPEAEIEDELKDELEDSEDVESDDQIKADTFDDAEMFIDHQIDGQDVSIADIKKWKAEGMMQADYTRKRQKDADDRRSWEEDKQSEITAAVSAKFESFDDSVEAIEALIKEADESVDWNELREYDSGEYLKQKELKDKRVKAVEDAKAVRQQQQAQPQMSDEQIKNEQSILIKDNPQWLDKENNHTDAHKQDLKMLSEFLSKRGFTEADHKRIVLARDWQTLIDAARYNQSLEKVEKVKAKVKKIPITTKPKKVATKKAKNVVEMFYGTS